ncbi:MAG: hypothetical protein RMK92_10480 [Armatimonadota bacterium]|nr:hypothetical protein [Armatimonadota bacterium]
MDSPLFWIDNNVLNYLCKAGCLDTVLRNASYRFVTTAFIQLEAERAVSAGVQELRSALDAMQRGDITVYDVTAPPLDTLLQPETGLGLSDESLARCARHYGGRVLTHDAALIRYLHKKRIGCLPFRKFLELASTEGWLQEEKVLQLKRLARIL